MALLNDVLLTKPKWSNFDWSFTRGMTMMPGPLYPVLCKELVPGTQVSMRVMSDVKTYPLKSPLYGSFRLQFATFFVPTRLYVQAMDQNKQIPDGDPSKVLFPTAQIPRYGFDAVISDAGSGGPVPLADRACVKRSSLMELMNCGTGTSIYYDPREENVADYDGLAWINLVPFVGYFDIFRNYYANTQEDTFPMFITTESHPDSVDHGGAVVKTQTPTLSMVSLSDLDMFIETVVRESIGGNRFDVDPGLPSIDIGFASNKFPNFISASMFHRNGGLVFATHRPDMFTAWLSPSRYYKMVNQSRVNVDSQGEFQNSFTINQFRFANKLQEFFERQIVAGSRYDDYVLALFGVHTSKDLCIPELLGVQTSPVIFNEVVSTASSGNGLGDLGGRGYSVSNGRTLRFTADEHGYLITIATIVPNVRYSTGIDPLFLKKDLMDLYSPSFDRIGFQPLPTPWVMCAPFYDFEDSDTTPPFAASTPLPQSSFGYQPAYTEYMTSVSRNTGDLSHSGQLNFWSLNRNFNWSTPVWDPDSGNIVSSINFSSYVFPQQFDYPFENQAIDAENFILDIDVDLRARVPKSKAIMPTL